MKIYKLPILLLILNLFSYSFSFAQTKKQLSKYAEEAFLEKNYYTAIVYFKQLLEIDDTQTDIKYKYAESLRLINDYQLAEKLYADVLQQDRGEKFPDCLFWLGIMQKQNSKYPQAKKTFENAAKTYKSQADSYILKKAKKEIESCDFAMKNAIADTTTKFSVLNIGKPVNSVHSEFAPTVINPDTIFFSSIRTPSDTSSLIEAGSNNHIKILKSIKNKEAWKTPEDVGNSINTENQDNGNFSISKDHQLAFFSRNNEKGLIEIYYTEKDKDGNWLAGTKLSEKINYPEYSSTQPHISNFKGKQVLFFVSDRPGGFGKFDIWYSVISKEIIQGKTTYSFKDPITLGKTINSIDNEITPFYDEVTDTLYFSSDWHNGFGGYDVFKTNGNLDNFSAAINMQMPINSAANDYYLSTFHENSDKTSKGFLASNRKGSLTAKGETCCNDIYYFEELTKKKEEILAEKDPVKKETAVTQAKLADKQGEQTVEVADALKKINQFLPLTLYFHNDEPNPKTISTATNLNYETTYKNYIALLNQYETEYSKGLETARAKEAVLDIDAFFKDFVDKGYNELGEFSKVLNDLLNSGHKVELLVKGYASPLAKSDYNVNLSRRRINSFKNYIREFQNGIFKKYLDKKALVINEEPNGEYKAGSLVSDNINDLKNSIFSRSAALERKIEVSLIRILPPVSNSTIKEKTEEKPQNKNTETSIPQLEIKEPAHDFGTITYGEKVSHKFKIKNTGASDLLIYNAIGSCGCTVPEWSKEPIAPGKEAEITVTFDSKGKFGKNNTSVTLITNGNPKTRTLNIAADVIIKK